MNALHDIELSRATTRRAITHLANDSRLNATEFSGAMQGLLDWRPDDKIVRGYRHVEVPMNEIGNRDAPGGEAASCKRQIVLDALSRCAHLHTLEVIGNAAWQQAGQRGLSPGGYIKFLLALKEINENNAAIHIRLDVGNNNLAFSDIAALALASGQSLKALDVSANACLGNDSSQILAGIQSLTSFQAVSCGISDCGGQSWAQHPEVKILDLSGNRIEWAGASALGRNQKLEYLDLSENAISDAGGEAALGSRNLMHLKMAYCEIGNRTAQAVAQHSQLETADLSGNNITDEGLSGYAAHRTLKSLDLSDNRITDRSASIIAGNPIVELVALSGNNIGDPGALAFVGTPNLKALSLQNTRITDKAVLGLAGLTTLEYLDVRENDLGPVAIQALMLMQERHPNMHIQWRRHAK